MSLDYILCHPDEDLTAFSSDAIAGAIEETPEGNSNYVALEAAPLLIEIPYTVQVVSRIQYSRTVLHLMAGSIRGRIPHAGAP